MEKHLNIQYVKSNNFFSQFSSGVYGGISVNGNICMNFFIDRVPIPDSLKVQLNEDGKVFEEDYSDSGVSSVREVTSCIIMDYHTAKSFHNWLGSKLSELENALNENK